MTTPAKNPFDADMHTFGMAYLNEYGEICYPSFKNDVIYYPQYGDAATQDISVFNRVPEHDLIPRKDVDALIEALKDIGYCKTYSYQKYPQKLVSMALKALSQFQSKHGGRHDQ